LFSARFYEPAGSPSRIGGAFGLAVMTWGSCKGVDWDLCAGEIVGLVGENGSGKSTLMKVLVGALDADAGTVEIAGRVGYCPQEPLLYERLTCDEHLELFGVAYQMTPDAAAASAESLYESLGFGAGGPPRWPSCRAAPGPS
jgi:ABC-type multidrug transport system ATPase subunit